MRLKGDPHSLALGTAIGVFVGIVPTVPFNTILIIIATFATRSSTIAALLSCLLASNPLTNIPLYYMSMIVGNLLTPYELTWSDFKGVVNQLMQYPGFSQSMKIIGNLGYESAIVLLVGGIVLALPCAIPSYFLSLRFFLKIREKRRQKHLLN